MLPKLLFLINPNAGHSGIRNDLLKVLELFSRSHEVTVYVTAGPGEITEKVIREASAYSLVVVSGGDGSLNEAVRGLLQLEEPPLLGYIPAGTANDVASSLKLSLNAHEAAKTVVTGEPFSMDLGSFNGRAFTYVAAFGAFTSVAYATPQKSKNIFGKLAEVSFSALEHVHRIPGTSVGGNHVKLEEFDNWISKTNQLAKENNYCEAHDIVLGKILSYSPVGEDGIWPAECVRNIFEKKR